MILHIDTETGWRGGERQLFLLAEGLKKHKIPQLILCRPGSALETRASEIGLPIVTLPLKGEWDLASVKALRELILSKGIKLIHAHTAKAHSIAWMAKAKLPNVKLVVSRRVDFRIRKNWFSKRKYISDRVDLFLSVSNRIREILVMDGIDPAKVVTVYSGIDLSTSKKAGNPAYLRKEFHLDKDDLIIGNIAALVDHKDQKTLLHAISLIETDKKFKVLIVGEGELKKELESLASEKKILDKVIFTGFRNDIPELLSVFDIFTLTSKEEGLGTSVLDAMASGLPIVATNGGGIAEMLTEGEGAFVKEVGDASSLAQAYKSLLEDPKLRKSMGAFNKEAVKRFSVKNTIKKTELAYYSLLGEEIYSKGKSGEAA
ncbi:glycosyltransferase family 1 protein [Leptospira langatensis]|uniref:Glycosyltransferase family 1 protein n=1 Tax=Leptospira langatensis TaxID=2484983 RepID=A0A5F1ZUZ8_9LEPT|nr:glycosyltransferase [Leptospira langatensis]TGK01293.1 glycosyltransferase family 1 protein [Leptospira langatensis]TGL42254.1 glycosyltransferase family 1 protein [Leptospira langatensis]